MSVCMHVHLHVEMEKKKSGASQGLNHGSSEINSPTVRAIVEFCLHRGAVHKFLNLLMAISSSRVCMDYRDSADN